MEIFKLKKKEKERKVLRLLCLFFELLKEYGRLFVTWNIVQNLGNESLSYY